MRYLLISFVVALLGSGCKKENLCDCFKGSGAQTEELRQLGSFSQLEVFKNVKVNLVSDSLNYAIVRGGKNLLELVETRIENDRLTIINKNKCNWVRSYKNEISVTLHTNRLEFIEHSGSNNIECLNFFTQPYFEVYTYNSGNVHMKVHTQHFYTRMLLASSDIYAEGTTNYFYAFGGNMGFIYADQLTADSSFVHHNGQGDIYVHAQHWLRAKIENIGNVYYRGSPVVESEITGSGKVIHR